MSEMSNPKVVSGLSPEEEQKIIDLFKMELVKSVKEESQESDNKFNDSDFQLPDVVKARIANQVFEELRRTSSGRKSTLSMPYYLSKADQYSFEAAPLEHVIQKGMDVGGDYSQMTDEERFFIGELTMKSLFPDD